LKLRNPLRILTQEGKYLPELLFLSHHDLLTSEMVVVGVLVGCQDDTAAIDHADLGTDL